MKKNLLLLPLAAFGVLATQACGTLKTYKVAFSVDQHIHYEDKVAYNNYDYVNKIQVDQGYYLTKYDFTIKVGDNALSFDEFNYDNYVLTIPKKFISANISVTAASTTFNGYKVDFDNDDKATWTGNSHTTLNEDYTATISIAPNIHIPFSQINITVNNVLLSQYVTLKDGSFVKAYDINNNVLTINHKVIDGPIHISHYGCDYFTVNYDQSPEETHVIIFNPSGTKYIKNTETVIKAEIDDDYAVNVNRLKIIDETTGAILRPYFDYNLHAYGIVIYKQATSSPSLKSYKLVFNLGIEKDIDDTRLENLTIVNAQYYSDVEYETYVAPSVGYKLPEKITIKATIDGKQETLVQDQDYTYDNKNGYVVIEKSVVAKTETIFFIGQAVGPVEPIKISCHGIHCKIDPDDPAYEKEYNVPYAGYFVIRFLVDKDYEIKKVYGVNSDGYRFNIDYEMDFDDETYDNLGHIDISHDALITDIDIFIGATKV